MTRLSCKVSLVEAITETVFRVRLVTEGAFSFRAGQYLLVVMGERDARPFSMASTPLETEYIELHIGTSKANPYTFAVMERMLQEREVVIDIPYGEAALHEESQRPLFLIAGGTGFSYTRSIMLTVLQQDPSRQVILYWGARAQSNLYALAELKALMSTFHHLQVVFVVEHPDPDWVGRTGTVLSAILDDFSSLAEYDIYIAGPFDMVKKARDRFCNERGAERTRIYSDAFAFL